MEENPEGSLLSEIETNGTRQELGATSSTTHIKQQHTIELGSYDLVLDTRTNISFSFVAFGMEVFSVSLDSLKEVRDCPIEINQEVVKVILQCRDDISKNKELLDLIKEYFGNSLSTLDYYGRLQNSLKRAIDSSLLQTQTKLQDSDEGNEGDLLLTQELVPKLANLHQQHNSIVKKLREQKANLDKKQDRTRYWRKILRFIFVTLVASVLIGSVVTVAIVTSPLATALVTAATSVPLASILIWAISLLKKYINVIKRHKEIINWMNGSSQLTMHDLVTVRPHITGVVSAVNEGTEESMNRGAALIKELEDVAEKVEDCSKNIRNARTGILQKIIKHPNHSTTEDMAFPLF